MRTAEETRVEAGEAASGDDIEVIPTPASSATRPRRFGWWLAGILVVALAVRIWCAADVMADRGPALDVVTVRRTAQVWADGGGMALTDSGRTVPTAGHVPVHVTLLYLLDRVGIDDAPGQRLLLGALSVLGVAAVGLLGRMLARPSVGLLAAGIAAVNPIWFQPASNLMSEGVFLWTVPLALLAAVWCRERATWVRLALMAVAIGIAGLTRSEAVLLFPTVALPIAWLSSTSWRRRLGALALTTAVFGMVLAPWVVRVHRDFGAWTLSTNQGGTLLGASCDASFSGPRIGGWSGPCFADGLRQPVVGGRNEAKVSDALQRDAIDYTTAHLDQFPKVVLARVGRAWGVAYVGDTLSYDVLEDRNRPLQTAGYAINWALMGLTVAGMVLLSRDQWRRWWILVPPIAIATLAAAAFWGTPRFRSGAEPSLVLFASFAMVELGGRIRRRWRSRTRGAETDHAARANRGPAPAAENP